jgi:hypothetical protein
MEMAINIEYSCSASQRDQVYADCVNLSALLRCARHARSPRVSHGAGAGVGRGVRGELAVELGEQRDAVGEAKLGAGRGERGVLRRRGAVDDEAHARKRLEHSRRWRNDFFNFSPAERS